MNQPTDINEIREQQKLHNSFGMKDKKNSPGKK